jgi:hypothetical protein
MCSQLQFGELYTTTFNENQYCISFNIAFIYQMITVNYIWKHLVFAYPKRERYYISSLCFEMAAGCFCTLLCKTVKDKVADK